MPSKKAQLFTNGGSQALRLPAEFRFSATEVYVRKDERTGDVIVSQKPGWATWTEFLAQRDASAIPSQFMQNRPLNRPFEDNPLWLPDAP